MVEIALLASTIVGKFLIPLFRKGRTGFTDELAEAGGRVAAESLVATASDIWKQVEHKFDRDGKKSVVELFQAEPEDMEKVFTKLLAQRLEADSEFRQQIQRLVDKPVPDTGRTSWQLIADVAGAVDARGATIHGGTVAGVVVTPTVARDAQDANETRRP